jgi:acetyl-CoA carboxylase biotin carboxylase subunit
LVSNMIKAAFHLSLDFKSQEDIKISGHAIELRICAEDPKTMLPAPGKIESFEISFPQGVRFDHCLYPGYQITSDFDPMIGKLIARGLNRETALRKMRSAIHHLNIEGLKTNIPLLRVILNEQNFKEGVYSTHYIQKIKPEDLVESTLQNEDLFEKVSLIDIFQKELHL